MIQVSLRALGLALAMSTASARVATPAPALDPAASEGLTADRLSADRAVLAGPRGRSGILPRGREPVAHASRSPIRCGLSGHSYAGSLS